MSTPELEEISHVVVMAVENALAPMRERLARLEATSAVPDSLTAHIARQAASYATLDVVRQLIEPLQGDIAALKARSTTPDPLVEHLVGQITELSTQIGICRERVAAAEVRPLTPGPSGRDGADGADGAPGVGFDDLEVLQQDDRTAVVRAIKGDRVKEIGTMRFPAQVYRGIWTDATAYERGDSVTLGGSEWHCNEPTTSKPGDGSKAWTLKVKRGRDGKDFRPGDENSPPLPIVRTK